MKLRANQRCPIPGHGFICPCRDAARKERKRGSKWETVRPGVRRIKDEHADHCDGYRYKYSPAEMRKTLDRKIEDQGGICALCNEPMLVYCDIAPDHILPKGMNGSRSDDRSENIQATHSRCNNDKGSKRG